jgi:phosphoribosylaminoimidazolecarboxamide formyltransferase / IMP cyclohydrolase
MPQIERALLSVTDKTGLVEFAQLLHDLKVELISTGGTAKLLRAQGLPIRDVSEVTGFPEMLDGRVKTIDPHIAGGILAIRSRAEHMQAIAKHGIQPIQMVVVNLYAFEKYANKERVTREELIENIDIGGPTMIRAAAKNFGDVAVVVSPSQYEGLAQELKSSGGSLEAGTHWRLAQEAFRHTAAYDTAIAAKLSSLDNGGVSALPETLRISAPRTASLRYGENPHQQAALYRTSDGGIGGAQQLHGKELSYIKHTNPCGCAEQDSLRDSYVRALEADPISAFGGVLAFNREVDAETAGEVSKLFAEAVAAPSFSAEALKTLTAKKNLRLVTVKPLPKPELVLKSITGGVLAQTADDASVTEGKLETKTKRHPTSEEIRALLFAWKVSKHVKSNAIVYARTGQLISAGAGQMSRLDAAKFGAMKAVLPLSGSVVASDAFFPFPDGLEEAAKHGVTAVIQPGGSVNDSQVIEAADRLDIAMVFTGVRHFRH